MTYSLKTRDFSEAVRRVKIAAVDTMKTFDDHRRKIATGAVVTEPVTNDPHERFLAAADAMAANDDQRAEPVAYTTLSRSQLNLFAELHRSLRLEDDEDARLGGFEAVRPGPGSSMLLFTADEKRLSGKPPFECYLDELESYSTNEVAVYWNSALVYALALYGAMAESLNP